MNELEAAELAASRGEHAKASDLFERACEFGRASKSALDGGDSARALQLAVIARDDELAAKALDAVKKTQASKLGALASQLELRGDYAWAARVHEARGGTIPTRPATGSARAMRCARRCSTSAATIRSPRRRRSRPRSAAIRSRTPRTSRSGALLVRYGKDEAAVRALQHVPRDSPARREALPPLARALGASVSPQAEGEATRELAALGGPAELSPAPAPATEVQRRIFGRYEVVREVASTPTRACSSASTRFAASASP